MYLAIKLLSESKHFTVRDVRLENLAYYTTYLEVVTQRERTCTSPVIFLAIGSLEILVVLTWDMALLMQLRLPLFCRIVDVDITIHILGHDT